MMSNWFTPSMPWAALIISLLLLMAPLVSSRRRADQLAVAGLVLTVLATFLAPGGVIAYLAVAATTLLHARGAAPASRTGAAALGLSACLVMGAGAAIHWDHLGVAFLLSSAAIAIRAGVLPLHAGVASLCDRALPVQTQQLASLIALVFVHLRFVDNGVGVSALAPGMIRIGATVAIAAALMSLVQRNLRGLYRSTTALHGGMLLAALGAAALDHFAAALLVVIAMALALGGLGLMITALEERVGVVTFKGGGGRIQAFPRLAASFAIFGAAGVGLPGTAGFVADDVLLHTLWSVSPTSAVVIVVSSALLAVATLVAYSDVFLGRAVQLRAPDLTASERLAAVALVLVLLGVGFAPGLLLGPANALLARPPAVANVEP